MQCPSEIRERAGEAKWELGRMGRWCGWEARCERRRDRKDKEERISGVRGGREDGRKWRRRA